MKSKTSKSKPKRRVAAARGKSTKRVAPNNLLASLASKFILIGAVIVALLVGVLLVRGDKGGVNLSLTPDKSSVAVGETLEVKLDVSTGSQEINVVHANISYPAANLEFVSFDDAGSGLKNSAQAEGANGQIKVARYAEPNTTTKGDQHIVTLKFKALAATDAAEIKLGEGSQVVRAHDSSNILSSNKEAVTTKVTQ